MRRIQRLCSVLLPFALLLPGCRASTPTPDVSPEPAPAAYTAPMALEPIRRVTDYLAFPEPQNRVGYRTDIGRRQLEQDGFSFTARTHAEYDFNIESDSLAEMTEPLGEQVIQSYRRQLEFNEYNQSVELAYVGMDRLAGQPAYHAKFHFSHAESARFYLIDFYCFAFDSALCVVEVQYERNLPDTESSAEQFLQSIAISERYVAEPADFGYAWQESYERPRFDYTGSQTLPLNEYGGLLRVDGLAYALALGEDDVRYIGVYDQFGHSWNIPLSDDSLAVLFGNVSDAPTQGVPVSVFGTVATGRPPDEKDPYEPGPALWMDAHRIVTAQDGAVYDLMTAK